LGDGANNYNAAENPFGGWFSYAGLFVVNGTPYGSNGNISGAGDFAFEMECCPDYYIIRQWTATDCSGNTSTCSQTITFGDNENNDVDLVTIPSEEVVDGELIVSVSPNPANNNARILPTTMLCSRSKPKKTLKPLLRCLMPLVRK